jgi:serine/threonine protein kinase
VDARTDLYSLGLVLYQLLTGVSLQRVSSRLSTEERLESVRRVLERTFPAAQGVRTDIPADVSEICMRMLERDPAKRYARAEDVARDLEQRTLYAKGFGPTNNSLQAYLEIFDAQFGESSPDQLRQLAFLPEGLKRSAGRAAYTAEGLGLLEKTLSR